MIVPLEQRDVLLRDASPSDLTFGICLKANLHILVIVVFVNQHECSVTDFLDCPEMVYPEGVCLFLVAALSHHLPDSFLRSLLELFLLGLVKINNAEELFDIGELAALAVVLHRYLVAKEAGLCGILRRFCCFL